jgi:predicted molibdopterin-dependent oxidoreductase YjgC
MTNSITEVGGAEVIFVIGSNTTEAHPQVARQIFRALDHGARLIVVDPRSIHLSRFAHLHLRPRPGTDTVLLNGMMRIILEENLVDDTFIEMRTENFAALRDFLYDIDMDEVERVSGISQSDLRSAAYLYATAKRAVILYCLGITQHVCGTDNVEALSNLAMLTGHVEQEFTGLDPLRGQNNVQGACDMGVLPAVFPGYQEIADRSNRQKFEWAWGTPLPPAPGKTMSEMLHGGADGAMRGMYIMGENPMLSDPDLARVRETLAGLEFLVVSDIFLTETAELADVVLPAASFAEKSGTVTNSERRVQLLREAVDPPANSRPDWHILTELATRMHYPMDYESTREIMEEIALLTPIYGGIYHCRLEDSWGLQWPCYDRKHPGAPFLHKGSFARGRGLFLIPQFRPPVEGPDAEYPLVLITGRVYFHYHTGAMTRASHILEREYPEALVEMNPADAKELNVRNTEEVTLASRRGEITIRVKVTDRVPKGILYAPFHFREAPVNFLTHSALDARSKIPEYKVCAVRAAKARS